MKMTTRQSIAVVGEYKENLPNLEVLKERKAHVVDIVQFTCSGYILFSFLVACTRLYNPLCPSVGRSVGRLVTLYFFYHFYFFKLFLVILSNFKAF